MELESRVLVIAEAGVNHNGDMNLAASMVRIAAEIGADVVKFQTFRTEALVTRSAPKAEYQKAATGASESQFDMLARLELSESAHQLLLGECRRHGIGFLSTAFDMESVELLARLKPSLWKIPSGQITDLPYLRRIGSFGARVLLSTGAASLGEVEAALDVLERAGTRHEDITVLHCTTDYPAPWSEVNLRSMVTLRDTFGLAVGYSDHTEGPEMAIAATALGARVIEKHFTTSRSLPGPDQKASMEPAGFRAMVESIRRTEIAMGDGRKRPGASEARNRAVVRKSIVAARPLRQGEILRESDLATRRAGSGISPMQWDSFVGRRVGRDYAAGEPLEW